MRTFQTAHGVIYEGFGKPRHFARWWFGQDPTLNHCKLVHKWGRLGFPSGTYKVMQARLLADKEIDAQSSAWRWEQSPVAMAGPAFQNVAA